MGNGKSKINHKFNVKKQIFTQSKDVTACLQRTYDIRGIQNLLLLWLDTSINDSNTDSLNTITQLHQIVNDVKTFTDGEECIQFIDNINNNKIYLIISGSLGQHIVPRIHHLSQMDSIFIFCSNKVHHEQWAKDWFKIKGVYTAILPICDALKQIAQEEEQNAISISFVPTSGSDDVSKKTLNQLDPIFMYSQILKEILLTIQFTDEHIDQFLDYCHDTFFGDDKQLKNVITLRTKYHEKTPIWWYTCESFLYKMLNDNLRKMDMDITIKMGFFITDLHRQIEQLYAKQFSCRYDRKVFLVYRGQHLSSTDFNKMKDSQGGLISFNNFLSTSKIRDVSLVFARSALKKMDMMGILFVMSIDPIKSTTSFASIVDVGYFGAQEDEVLFSMHTVFRIGEIIPMDENPRLFQVYLTLTSDEDKDLRILTDRIRKEIDPYAKGWYRLGVLLLQVGESAKAQQVYEILIEQAKCTSEQASLFHQLGRTKDSLGEYQDAITWYNKALEIYEKTLSHTDLTLAHCYNDIGTVYKNIKDYSKALSYHEKSLDIKKQSLPSDHLDLAMSFNNIGTLYNQTKEYVNALPYFEQALEIRKQSLPLNHPDLAASYNNIGNVYFYLGDYLSALASHEKALDIRKQSLPSNHPDLAMSYNNIGGVYENMNDYSKAHPFYERAVKIGQDSLRADHHHLQTYKRNLEDVKNKL